MTDFTKYTREDFLADESFVNYLLQKNANDIQFWENWIRKNPQCGEEIKQAGLLFLLIKDQKNLSHHSKKQVDIERQYFKLQSLLKENNSEKEDEMFFLPAEKKIQGKSLFRKLIWQAAGVAAILVIGVSLWNFFGPSIHAKSEFILFAKSDSSVKEIILPDGSLVQLNNFSTVEIAKNYNHNKREVQLTGSAFFKVYKDHSKPFIVTSGSIKTTALGTAFYIYSLHPQSISVSLLEGTVRVEGDKNYLELLPGEKAIYNMDARIFKDSFNKNQLLDFTNGKIQFEHADLREIKTVLEEYFNKDVWIEGDSPKLNFTGKFDSKKIETILKALQFTYNITYQLEGQKVIISFN